MSCIKISASARADIHRLYDFLAQFDVTVADNGNATIIDPRPWMVFKLILIQ
jgi:hypothetical protein